MAIRQVTSRSIKDGEIVANDIANTSITGAKLALVLVVLVSSKEKTVTEVIPQMVRVISFV